MEIILIALLVVSGLVTVGSLAYMIYDVIRDVMRMDFDIRDID